MKADFTRNTFRPFQQFTSVLMQQGRVQLDSDWNEQNAILQNFLRTLAADLIGPHGGPANNLGFNVTPVLNSNTKKFDLVFSAGHYYVDGILCEIQGFPVAITAFQPNNVITVARWDSDGFQIGRYVQISDTVTPAGQTIPVPVIAAITAVNQSGTSLTLDRDVSAFNIQNAAPSALPLRSYAAQPDYPGAALLDTTTHQVYLDVWERLVTYVQDDYIREVALGGPDTCARSKLVCQVKVTNPGQGCLTPQNLASVFQPDNRGMLIARASQTAQSTDPCIISPNASYRGPENQLYRVEIHTGSHDANGNTATPTFKWSRENGSVVFPIIGGGGTNAVTLANLGKDDRFGLAQGDWVEVQDDTSELLQIPGSLLQVQSIDTSTRIVTLNSGTANPAVGKDLSKHPLLRRWDYQAGDASQDGLQLGSDNTALIIESTTNWLALEDGIEIQFQPAPSGFSNEYRTGDYWLIPARTATGDVAWPAGVAKPPDGVTHHYAPLAVVEEGKPTSCQVQFQSLVTR